MKGKLIVIEGTDCSGKETQTRLLLERFKEDNIKAFEFSFPNYNSPTGKIIGGPYLGKDNQHSSFFKEGTTNVNPKVAALYYAADRKYNIDKITFLLENGANVILDRYIYSNMAHQGGKITDKNERQNVYKWLEKLEFDLLELPKPDIAIFLHMPIEQSVLLKKNRNSPHEHEKDITYLKGALKAYKELALRYDMYTIECAIDGNIRSTSDINEDIYKYIKDKL